MAKVGSESLSVNLKAHTLSERWGGRASPELVRSTGLHSQRTIPSRWIVGAVVSMVASACSSETKVTAAPAPSADAGVSEDTLPVEAGPSSEAEGGQPSEEAGTSDDLRAHLSGEDLFGLPFPGAKNERSCATCHVPEDNYTLTPEHVAKLWKENPNDPLFSAIDADDPTADELTFHHLEKGLVRVWLTLPENADLIDDDGNVNTPEDRKMFVWRAVPSLMDVALTAPYQLDGRAVTLEEQAQGAVRNHSQGGTLPDDELGRIAEFERTLFSSDRARSVAEQLANGVALEDVSEVEATLDLTEEEQRGREVYGKVCGNCHGGATTTLITDRKLHDMSFPVLKPDGTLLYEVPATAPPTVALLPQPNNEFMNNGTAIEMFLALLGATEHESFSSDVGFPNYRYRFYTDESREEISADVPPVLPFDFGAGGGGPGPGPGASSSAPDAGQATASSGGAASDAGTDSGGGGDASVGNDAGTGGGGAGGPPGGAVQATLDENGNPIVGLNGALQLFSTDPGRAMITGKPNDFEAFDIPSLRGIAKTAPYFHNNTVTTLEEVVSLYSDHLLSKWPQLIQPGEKEVDPDGDTGPEEALTKQHKSDLVAFLKRL